MNKNELMKNMSQAYLLLSENRKPNRTFKNNRLCKKGNPSRRNATTLGQITP